MALSKIDRTSEVGYGASGKLGYLRDVMELSLNTRDVTSVIEEMTAKTGNDWMKFDPFSGKNKPSLSASFNGSSNQTQSVTSLMRPNKSYNAAPQATDTMKRDVNMAVRDGKSVAAQAGNAKESVNNQIAEFKKDFTAAKKEAATVMKDIARDMGVSPNDALASIIPPPARSGLDAAMFVGAELATAGAGMAAKVAFAGTELSKTEKQLSPEKQEAIIKATLEQLQSSPAKTGFEMTDEAPKAAPKSDIAWQNLDAKRFEEFLKADVENQPEMMALRQNESDLDLVADNHGQVKEGYSQKSTAGKKEVAIERGEKIQPAVSSEDVIFVGADVQETKMFNLAGNPEALSGVMEEMTEYVRKQQASKAPELNRDRELSSPMVA